MQCVVHQSDTITGLGEGLVCLVYRSTVVCGSSQKPLSSVDKSL